MQPSSSHALRIGAWIALTTILAVSWPQSAQAQRALGQVVDAVSRTVVPGTLVTIRDGAGEMVGMAISDARGEYSISLPSTGPFNVSARAPGYQELAAESVRFDVELPTLLHFELDPDPLQLEGIEVELGAETRIARELAWLGLSAMELGERMVTRDEIEVRQTARDVGAVLEWQQISGLQIARTENTYGSNGPPMLCAYLARGRTAMGQQRCALTVLDGVPIATDVAEMIDPDNLEAIIILNPVEATQRFGTAAGGGALLLFSRVKR